MEDKVSTARQEAGRIAAKLDDVRTRADEAQVKKMEALARFGSLEYKALEFRLRALESPRCERAKKALSSAEANVRRSKDQLDFIVQQLTDLEEEESGLLFLLEEAKDSSTGAVQVLRLIQAELNTVLLKLKSKYVNVNASSIELD